jgi:hypothetical protein
MLILLRFVFPGKGEKPNDINGCIVKSDRLLAAQAAQESFERGFHGPDEVRCVGPGDSLFGAELNQIDLPAKLGARQDSVHSGGRQDSLLNMRHRIGSASENRLEVQYQKNPTSSR